MKAHLYTSSNGHLAIDFGDCSGTEWEALENTIVHTWGFQRVGTAVMGLDEKIHPSFKRSDLTLATGWDIWSRHYLLSQCTAGDEFLHTLFFELQH
jgi:hypothetical protein